MCKCVYLFVCVNTKFSLLHFNLWRKPLFPQELNAQRYKQCRSSRHLETIITAFIVESPSSVWVFWAPRLEHHFCPRSQHRSLSRSRTLQQSVSAVVACPYWASFWSCESAPSDSGDMRCLRDNPFWCGRTCKVDMSLERAWLRSHSGVPLPRRWMEESQQPFPLYCSPRCR